ncbi:transglutaminase-like domain-containing protein [Brachybacterium huguangmaarense]
MSTAATGRSPSWYAQRRPRARLADMLAITVLLVAALGAFAPVYGGAMFWVTGLAALLFALIIAWAGARWRWGPLPIAIAVILVHCGLGTPFAAPTRALWGVVPTLGSLLELAVAPVRAWRVTLTMAPPVGSAQGVLAVVWLSMLLLGLFAYTIVLRTRRWALAWLFPFGLLAVGIVFGTREEAWPLARGTVFAVGSVAWIAWRHEASRLGSTRSTIISDAVDPGSWGNPVLRRRVIGGAIVIALAAGAAIAARPLLEVPEGSARYALRDEIVPPFDPHDYTSPLAQFRGYIKNQRDTALFTVRGLSEGDLVPIATMDSYDREVFLVAGGSDKNSPSGAFLRTATDVDLVPEPSGERTATFTIGAYDRVWMPTAGARTTRVSPDGPGSAGIAESLYMNTASQTLVARDGLHRGEAYTVGYLPYAEPTPTRQRTLRFGDIALPSLPRLDPALRAKALSYMGDARTDYERMQNLTAAIKNEASFTHGLDGEPASWPGHSEYRLAGMLQEKYYDPEDLASMPVGMIGDQEQLAALTTVLARSAGVPARVVMGFTVPAPEDGVATVTGNEVTAWVEVYFEGEGWVRFDPTPEEDKDPIQPDTTYIDDPKPQIAQPPPPPVEPPRLPPAMTGESGKRDVPEPDALETWQLVSLLVASPFLLVLLAAAAIVGAKALRRRRRRRRGGPDRRVLGGWLEYLDTARDLGLRPPPRATRLETAAALAGALEERAHAAGDASAGGPDDASSLRAEALALARVADGGAFAPDVMPAESVERYWAQVMESRRRMRSRAGRLAALRGSISLRSLLPGRDRRAPRRRRTKERGRR